MDKRSEPNLISEHNGLPQRIPRTLLRLETHLVEHCNLNCHMCTHFSPLAKPVFADIKEFERDMKRLAILFGNEVEYIMLLGGEPLLHPDITDFFHVARAFFPETNIILYTNGIILDQMDQNFWSACKSAQIEFILTKYPIKVDYKVLAHTIWKHEIKYKFCNTPGREKKSSHFPFDLQGQQDAYHSFISCDIANRCIFLREGKLYTCCIAPNIHHFNHYFNTNLSLSPQDCINIYQAKDKKEILNFLTTPIPFCRYCDVKNRTEGNDWRISNRNISEWTV
ncbi:radical SAM protein [Desulfosporosinus hippei]|uniref:4Fe-4S single cluster domain-containing protein n=1 Tax=Desulfosporosinus hippei DSM 8344 TaxID=1121419 RepID=A0A1G8D449_9FIRM|nr:radical SAM protein [Desulfosporosinus hippei]SDH52294.1 4Fe-4S single cluster domain-containing protein [Desulfosporosinus hippei DSM 8344]